MGEGNGRMVRWEGGGGHGMVEGGSGKGEGGRGKRKGERRKGEGGGGEEKHDIGGCGSECVYTYTCTKLLYYAALYAELVYRIRVL